CPPRHHRPRHPVARLPANPPGARLSPGFTIPRASMRRALFFALLILCALPAAPGAAEDYPSRPIRIIVPTPAGGPVDVMARLLANALPATLHQSVCVENKPGAGNTLGSRLAAAADPDGYTLMVSAASGLIISPIIYKTAGYSTDSFAPIVLIAEAPQV